MDSLPELRTQLQRSLVEYLHRNVLLLDVPAFSFGGAEALLVEVPVNDCCYGVGAVRADPDCDQPSVGLRHRSP